MRSCWSPTGFKDSKSEPGPGEPREGVEYRGEAEGGKEECCGWTEEMKFSVREREAWIFLVRTSRTSLKVEETEVSFPCSRKTTFLVCSPSWLADVELGFKARERVCNWEIWELSEERSCLMMNVNSLISMGRSSKSVLRLANRARFSNFSMVDEIPLPISAAFRANSDLLGFEAFASPFAAFFCESVRRDCLCAPTLEVACLRWNWVRTDRNSFVRSCIDDTAILKVVAAEE